VERCDVLVVGGGPAGSTCARELARAGLDALVIDRAHFPRDKVCAGWITPPVLAQLDLTVEEYRKPAPPAPARSEPKASEVEKAASPPQLRPALPPTRRRPARSEPMASEVEQQGSQRVLQPIRGFRVSRAGSREAVARFDEIVSYGIRRCEFDHALLARSGARLATGVPLRALERAPSGRGWVANGEIETRVVVGAGGHFCPVARHLGASPGSGEPTVVAREIEFEMTPEQLAGCPVEPDLPELEFAPDLRGYGWIVRKGDWLNVGLGRQDPERFPEHMASFLERLEDRGRIPPGTPRRSRGHAYLLWSQAARPIGGPDALLAGDAAGGAYDRSGEGIRPAVESGRLAARAIADALRQTGTLDDDALRGYARSLERRFGPRYQRVRRGPTDWLPPRWRGPVAGRLLGLTPFARNVVVSRWFLHRTQ